MGLTERDLKTVLKQAVQDASSSSGAAFVCSQADVDGDGAVLQLELAVSING